MTGTGASHGSRGLLLITAGDQTGRVILLARDSCMTFGRDHTCDVRLQDSSVSRVHARVEEAGHGWRICDAGSKNGTFVNTRRISTPTRLDDGDYVRLGLEVRLRFSLVDLDEERAIVLGAQGSERDALTGVFARAHGQRTLSAEIRKATVQHLPLSVMMIAVDQLREIEATDGAGVCDEILAGLPRIIRTAIRSADLLARCSAEELLVIAPCTTLEEAWWVADRIRNDVSSAVLAWKSRCFRVTTSIGVASLACCGALADPLCLLFLAHQRTSIALVCSNAVVARGGNLASLNPPRTGESTLA